MMVETFRAENEGLDSGASRGGPVDFDDPGLFGFEDSFASLVSLGRVKKRAVKTVREDIAFMRNFCRIHLRPLVLTTDLKIQKDPNALATEMLDLAAKHRIISRFIPKFMGGKSSGVLWSVNPATEEAASVEPAFQTGVLGGLGLGMVSLIFTQNYKVIDWVVDRIVRGEANGRPFLIDTAITEPLAGTDVEEIALLPHAKLMTHARGVDGGVMLNGRKCFITGGHLARCHVVLAPMDVRDPVGSMSMFLVPADSPGFSLGVLENKMGQKAGPASELIFDDCFIPEEHIVFSASSLPKQHQGLLFDLVLGLTRITVGATGTGIARGAFEHALSFAKKQRWKGKTIINRQWAQEALTNMLIRVYQARALYMEATHVLLTTFLPAETPRLMDTALAAWLYRRPVIRKMRHSRGFTRFMLKRFSGHPVTDYQRLRFYSSLAKVAGTDAGMENCQQALDLMGYVGLRHEAGAEKLFRDAKLCQIFEGANQLNRLNMFDNFIARDIPGVETY